MEQQFNKIIISPNGRFLVLTHYNGKIDLADLSEKDLNYKILKENKGVDLNYDIKTIKWTKFSNYVAIGLGNEKKYNGFEIFDYKGQFVKEIKQMETPIRDIAWHPTNKYIATLNDADKTIRIWDTKEWKIIKSFIGYEHKYRQQMSSNYGLECINWSSDGKFLASGNLDGVFEIFDFEKGASIYKNTDCEIIDGGQNRVYRVEWSDNSERLATLSINFNRFLKIWDTKTWKLINEIKVNNERPVNYIEWSEDGNYIATAINDYGRDEKMNRVSVGGDTVKVYNINTKNLVFSKKIDFPETLFWHKNTLLVIDTFGDFHINEIDI